MTAPPPRFFIDRSLGAHKLPTALRAAGWVVVTMRERYGELTGQATEDPDWIRDATEAGEVLLCKDKMIARRPLEALAIVSNGARAFTMASGDISAEQMAERFIRHQATIFRRATNDPGPFVVSVAESHLDRLTLHPLI